jgi:hypothetical protein
MEFSKFFNFLIKKNLFLRILQPLSLKPIEAITHIFRCCRRVQLPDLFLFRFWDFVWSTFASYGYSINFRCKSVQKFQQLKMASIYKNVTQYPCVSADKHFCSSNVRSKNNNILHSSSEIVFSWLKASSETPSYLNIQKCNF